MTRFVLFVLLFSFAIQAQAANGELRIYDLNVQELFPDGRPMEETPVPFVKQKVVLSEYRVKYFGNKSWNERHKTKTNEKGIARISYRENMDHTGDTHLCIEFKKGAKQCLRLKQEPGVPPITCFDKKWNSCDLNALSHVCAFYEAPANPKLSPEHRYFHIWCTLKKAP